MECRKATLERLWNGFGPLWAVFAESFHQNLQADQSHPSEVSHTVPKSSLVVSDCQATSICITLYAFRNATSLNIVTPQKANGRLALQAPNIWRHID